MPYADDVLFSQTDVDSHTSKAVIQFAISLCNPHTTNFDVLQFIRSLSYSVVGCDHRRYRLKSSQDAQANSYLSCFLYYVPATPLPARSSLWSDEFPFTARNMKSLSQPAGFTRGKTLPIVCLCPAVASQTSSGVRCLLEQPPHLNHLYKSTGFISKLGWSLSQKKIKKLEGNWMKLVSVLFK